MNKHLLAVKAILDKKKAAATAKLAQATLSPEQKTQLDDVMSQIDAAIAELDAAAEDATADQIAAIFSKAVETLSVATDQSVNAIQTEVAAKLQAMTAKLESQNEKKNKKFSAKLSMLRASKSDIKKDSDGFRPYSAGVDVEAWTPEAEIDSVETFRPMVGVAAALKLTTTSNRMIKIRKFGATGGAFAVVVKHGAAPVITMQADQSIVEVQKYMGVVENVAIEDFEDNPGLESEIQDVAFNQLAQDENAAAIALLKGAAIQYSNPDFAPKVGADEKTALVAIPCAVNRNLGTRRSAICLALNSSMWALLGDLRNSNGTPIPIDSVLGSIKKVEDNTLVGDEFICWAEEYAKLAVYKGQTSEWYQGVHVTKDGANVTSVYSEVRTDEKSLAVRVRELMYVTDSSVVMKGTISGVVAAVTKAVQP